MTELYFLRHGQRIDHAKVSDPDAVPLYPDYKPYDPSLALSAEKDISNACEELLNLTQAFSESPKKKNIHIHFLPYLRCCQTADLMVTYLKQLCEQKYPQCKIRFQLLCDFALSEWIHERMTNKPPFYDSNDAYQMYTPNIKLLKNRSACSNFRPTNTLGHYNGYDLSYKDYQDNCKEYFKKLLATYDKPLAINNKDIIVVVSHGYFINNLLLYFVTHPIFDEIPEAKINFAKKDENGWVLVKDALDMFDFEAIDKTLNLETDIVYYKTNFIKRDELNQKNNDLTIAMDENPRPSFKIRQTLENYKSEDKLRTQDFLNNPICPAARDWNPRKNKFLIRNEFKIKNMRNDIFKQAFDITKPPVRPPTPEISPLSEPTRNNSVIDLSKLGSLSKPMKLKYSTTDEIPIETLNKKVNSQLNLNLAQHQRSYPSSNNSLISDFPKFALSKRKDYFSQSPKLVSTFSDESSDMDVESIDSNDDRKARPPPNPLLNRSKSLKYKEELALNGGRSILALYQKAQQQNNDSEEENFTLSFNNKPTRIPSNTPPPAITRSRKNSIKFIPSVLGYEHPDRKGNDTPVGMYPKKVQSMFYNLDDDSDSNEGLVLSGDENEIDTWFGQNRK